MIDEMPAIRHLHSLYESGSGEKVILTMQGVMIWQNYIATGYTDADLRLVLSFLRAKVAQKRLPWSVLRFGRLIGNLENYGDDLSEARATARAPRPPPHGRTLHQTGHTAPPAKDTAKPVGDVMAGNAALAELLKLRDSL